MVKKKLISSNDSFFLLQRKIRDLYFLSIQRQKTARRKLENSGVLIVERNREKEEVNRYKINFDRLCSLFDTKALKIRNPWRNPYGPKSV